MRSPYGAPASAEEAISDVASALTSGLTQNAMNNASCLADDTLIDSLGQRNVVDGLYAIALSLMWIHLSIERLADVQEAAANDQERAA